MGAEMTCSARHAGKKGKGTAHLDADALTFRGAEVKFKVRFSEILELGADAKTLRLRTETGETTLELGAKSAAWMEKIRHPPTRMTKAGVKSGMRVALVGIEDAALEAEIASAGALVVARGAELVFLQADQPKQLAKLKKIKARTAWIVSPRGKPEIADTVVIAAARDAGWVDVKVMRFNDTHTALKFVRKEAP